MGLSDRVSASAFQFKEEVKSKTQVFMLLVVRLISGGIIGLTFAIAFQEIMKYGTISFFFIITIFTLLFLKMTKSWGFVSLFIFDLFCVLVAMLLRMYLIIAPG